MPHIHEKIDFTVEVFIVHNQKVLLRKHDKYKFWLSVGGHIELDEDPEEAALREVKEEVGLDVELVPTVEVPTTEPERYKHILPPAYINRHSINDKHEHITFIYFAKANTENITQGDVEISEACQWFSIKELDQLTENISLTVKNYAKKALESINSIT